MDPIKLTYENQQIDAGYIKIIPTQIITADGQTIGKEGIVLDATSIANDFKNKISLLNALLEFEAQLEIEFSSNIEKPLSFKAWIKEIETHELEIRKFLASDSLTRIEGWGYPMLNSVQRYLPKSVQEFNDGIYWFHFGRFVNEHLWRVNKVDLAEALKYEAIRKNLFFCASFDFAEVLTIIERLPHTIDLNKNKNWLPFYKSVITEKGVQKQATGIIHKNTKETETTVKNGVDYQLQKEAKTKSSSDKEQEREQKNRFIPKTSFSQVGGLDHLVRKVREVIELPLKQPELFKHLGIKPHKGVLLYGPPGCGKTMIAKAIAHEIQAHFISVKGPELLNKYQGQSEENLRELFEEARELQPAIIFFDEIDAIAQSRSSAENLRMDARMVNQLLTMLDGVEDYGDVCVIAATNRIELLDEALLRPGRFDYKLEIPMPNDEACKSIFDIQTHQMPIDDKVDKEQIYCKLNGLSGAEIAYVAREAAYVCLRRHVDFTQKFESQQLDSLDYQQLRIETNDFIEALSRLNSNH